MRPLFTTLVALIAIGVVLPSGDAQTVPPLSADEVLSRARDLYFGDGPTAALPVYEEALALYRQDGNRLGEAITLGLIGNCYKRMGDYEQSLTLLTKALEMSRRGQDPESSRSPLLGAGRIRCGHSSLESGNHYWGGDRRRQARGICTQQSESGV